MAYSSPTTRCSVYLQRKWIDAAKAANVPFSRLVNLCLHKVVKDLQHLPDGRIIDESLIGQKRCHEKGAASCVKVLRIPEQLVIYLRLNGYNLSACVERGLDLYGRVFIGSLILIRKAKRR